MRDLLQNMRPDRIEDLIAALKRHKKNAKAEPKFGDWSPYLDELEPFRDGKSYERVGSYIGWLLESLDRGYSRDEAVGYANGLYAGTWGTDKVVASKASNAH